MCVKPGVMYESSLLKPACANTVYPPHLLSPATYVQNRYVQKTSWCRSRASPGAVLWWGATAGTPSGARRRQGYHPDDDRATQRWHLAGMRPYLPLTQRHMRSPVTFTWKVFSQSGSQTSLTTMSWPVKPSPVKEVVDEEKKKEDLGNFQTEAFCLTRQHLRERGMRLLSVKLLVTFLVSRHTDAGFLEANTNSWQTFMQHPNFNVMTFDLR